MDNHSDSSSRETIQSDQSRRADKNLYITGGQFVEVHGNYGNYVCDCTGVETHNHNIHQHIHHPSLGSPGVVPPIPPLRHSSTMFTGRDIYLQKLMEYFCLNSTKKRKSFLLHGMGGIGKTQICLKFSEENGNL
jgi:hypothetical protein